MRSVQSQRRWGERLWVPSASLFWGLQFAVLTLMNTRRLGAVISGLIISVGSATALGDSGIFAVCAALTVVGLTAVVAAGRMTGRSTPVQ